MWVGWGWGLSRSSFFQHRRARERGSLQYSEDLELFAVLPHPPNRCLGWGSQERIEALGWMVIRWSLFSVGEERVGVGSSSIGTAFMGPMLMIAKEPRVGEAR